MRVFSSLLFFLFLIAPAFADQLLIEPDIGRKPILEAIHNAKHSIKLVMYGFTDEALLNALIQKKIKGQTVKIILEENPYKAEDENKKAIAKLNANYVPWQGSIPPHSLIHQKTLLIDDNIAIIMTFNFTRSAFDKHTRNFGLIIDDAKRVNKIAALFSADWNHLPTNHKTTDILVSPDNSRESLNTLLQQAKLSIRIYAQDVNDFKIIGTLAKAAKKGVKIEILTSKKIRKKQASYLTHAGISIRHSQNYYIHAKVFILDNKKAIIGSLNLTRASLDNNREVSVITEDAQVIEQLNKTFNHDWNTAERGQHVS